MKVTAAPPLVPRLLFALACLVLDAGGAALAAGYAHLEVPGTGGEPPIQAMVWTPCSGAATSAQLGPYEVHGAPDCPVLGDALPLIVISHGQGGTLLGHHDTAAGLADAGFVVVTFNHPGDTFDDDSATQRLGIFESRPRDVTRVISFMLDEWSARRHLAADAVGIFGFSRGGYTALAAVGARPSLRASGDHLCGGWFSFIDSLCRQLKRADARLAPAADPRIRAAVVVDPLNLFDAVGLQPVDVPVQLWASEQGGAGVTLAQVEVIRTALPREPEYHVAKGAGHFAFLAPCPPAFRESAPRLCVDPDGFDRSAWHRTMNAAVTKFFSRHLLAGSGSRPVDVTQRSTMKGG